MKRFLDLFIFLSLDLHRMQKIRILLGYCFLSRYGCIKILGIRLHYLQGLKSHSLLILKEVFIKQIYTFSHATDQKLNSAKNAVIIDVGANIGVATAYFKHKYPKIKLIAIEASPVNYQELVNNIKANKFQNISTMNCFISKEKKHIKFYHDIKKPGSSFGEGFRFRSSTNLKTFNVKTKKIEDIIGDLKNIVIKIDVEGSEYEILENLASSKNISEVLEVLVEVSTYCQTDYNDLSKVINKFYQLGFEPRLLTDQSTEVLNKKSIQNHIQLNLVRCNS